MLCTSVSSNPFANSPARLDFGILMSSIMNTAVPITRPTAKIIIMMPNCVRLRGWLCLTFGSGMGMGGFMISSFTLLRIPVSFNHRIDFRNLSWINSRPLNHRDLLFKRFTCNGLPFGKMKLECLKRRESLLK